MSEFRVRTRAPESGEDQSAKEHWATTTFQARKHSARPPFYAREVCRLIARLRPSSVLEFGCNAGRNLELLLRTCRELSIPKPRVAGIDVNEESIAFGRDQWGLDLRVGDESLLAASPDGAWDVAFTISVIDHVPEPAGVLSELARVTGQWLILVEPHHTEHGRVESYRSSVDDQAGEVTPYSYVHDYDALTAALGWSEVLNIPFPTGLARLGPLYRLRLLAATPDVASQPPPEASAEHFLRAAILGIAEERRARIEEVKALRERIRELKSRSG